MLRSLLLMLALSPPALGAPASASPWTAEMFGALPSHSDVEISPDGKRLALLQTEGKTVQLVLRELDVAGMPARATRIEGAEARGLFWAGNDHLLVLVSQTLIRKTNRGVVPIVASRWLAFSAATLQARVLFGDEDGYFILSPGTLLATPVEGDALAIFSRWTTRGSAPSEAPIGSRIGSDRRGGGLGLLSVRLDSGEDVVVAAGTPNTMAWQVAANGDALLRSDADVQSDGTVHSQLHLRSPDGAKTAGKLELDDAIGDLTSVEVAGRSAIDGKQLVFGRSGGLRGIWEFDLETKQIGRTLFTSGGYDADGVIYDHRLAGVRGVRYVDDMPRMHHFDPDDQRAQRTLAAALPGSSPLIVSRSADGMRLVAEAHYTDHPPQWFLYRRDRKSVDMIAPSHALLDGKKLPKKEKFDHVTGDGFTIAGYLTVPIDAAADPLPLVVLPHGGPQARDDQAFDFWSGFYAARGYLVYQPNFRGSDGYGKPFREAGDGEWGRRMQQDIDDGVRRLIAEGRARSGRVCIVGASYGGYAALVGATMAGDLYACAVSVNGIANVGDLFDSREPQSNAYWEKRIGTRHDREALHRISPFHHAAEAQTPVLLIHAKDDAIVPIGQSRIMARALEKHRKPVEFVELDGEDHWLSSSASRIQMLDRSIAFIDRHLAVAGDTQAHDAAR
jgi:dipeptidyl aminopeptidase/acylaminoacyl peptidase